MGRNATVRERARRLLAPLVLLSIVAPAFAEHNTRRATIDAGKTTALEVSLKPMSGTAFGRSRRIPIEAGGCTSALLDGQLPDELNNDIIRMLELFVLQERLRDQGYYSGPIDGALGPLTRAAIRRCQKSQNVPVTGPSMMPRLTGFAKPAQALKKGGCSILTGRLSSFELTGE